MRGGPGASRFAAVAIAALLLALAARVAGEAMGS